MRKNYRFGLLLSPSERLVLEKLAELEGGLSQAALIRRLIRKAAKRRDLWPPLWIKNLENFKVEI